MLKRFDQTSEQFIFCLRAGYFCAIAFNVLMQFVLQWRICAANDSTPVEKPPNPFAALLGGGDAGKAPLQTAEQYDMEQLKSMRTSYQFGCLLNLFLHFQMKMTQVRYHRHDLALPHQCSPAAPPSFSPSRLDVCAASRLLVGLGVDRPLLQPARADSPALPSPGGAIQAPLWLWQQPARGPPQQDSSGRWRWWVAIRATYAAVSPRGAEGGKVTRLAVTVSRRRHEARWMSLML